MWNYTSVQCYVGTIIKHCVKTYNGRINSILELSECGVNVYPQGLRPILAVVVLAIPESTYICIWRRISSLQPSTF